MYRFHIVIILGLYSLYVCSTFKLPLLIVKLNNCHRVAGSANQRSPSIDSVLDIVHHAKNFPRIFATSRYSAEQSSTLKHKNDSNPFYQGNEIFQPFNYDTKIESNFMAHLYGNQ